MFTLRAVLKINPGQIPGMGWGGTVLFSCQIPTETKCQGNLTESIASSWIFEGWGVFYPPLNEEKWPGTLHFHCFLERGISPSSPSSAGQASSSLHFMDEERQPERHWFAQGRTRLLTASRLAHVQPIGLCCMCMSCHLKSSHSQSFGVRGLDGQTSSQSCRLYIMIPQNGSSELFLLTSR